MIILDQNKPISLYLKIKNPKFINWTLIIHKNRNNTSIQPILKLNSKSFMFKTIIFFCEMNCKKLSTGRGLGENGGPVLILSWKCNFTIYLDIQVYYLDIQVYYLDIQAISTLLRLIFILYVLFPSIHSIFYVTTTLLKSDESRHSKA